MALIVRLIINNIIYVSTTNSGVRNRSKLYLLSLLTEYKEYGITNIYTRSKDTDSA